jgi:hypothetical protein
VNPEQVFEEEVQLICSKDECDNVGRDTRAELQEEGWSWQEGSLHGLFSIKAVECPDCEVDIESVYQEKKEEVNKYYGAQTSNSDSQKQRRNRSIGDFA